MDGRSDGTLSSWCLRRRLSYSMVVHSNFGDSAFLELLVAVNEGRW